MVAQPRRKLMKTCSNRSDILNPYLAALLELCNSRIDMTNRYAAIIVYSMALDRADSKAIPIIALTANAFDEDVQRSLQAGLNAHLSKPVDPDTLFETLESLIKP